MALLDRLLGLGFSIGLKEIHFTQVQKQNNNNITSEKLLVIYRYWEFACYIQHVC